MKALIIAIIITLATTVAQAGEVKVHKSLAELDLTNPEIICKMTDDLSREAMISRQFDDTLNEFLEMFKGKIDVEQINTLIKDIAIKAYEKPVYKNADAKGEAIDSFVNEMVLQCYKKHN